MARIAGIFYFDARPISAEDRDQLDRSIGGLGAVFQWFTAPGLRMACNASIDPHGEGRNGHGLGAGSICTLDGRVDNRPELLGKYIPAGKEATDSALALTIYETRGPAGLHDLI